MHAVNTYSPICAIPAAAGIRDGTHESRVSHLPFFTFHSLWGGVLGGAAGGEWERLWGGEADRAKLRPMKKAKAERGGG